MQVIVKGRNTHVSEHLKELATSKLEKVSKVLDRIQTLEVEFSEEHNPRIADKHTVEVTLTTKAHLLRAHASGPDPASAVDRVLHKLQSQVKRLKGKMVERGSRARNSHMVKGASVPFDGAGNGSAPTEGAGVGPSLRYDDDGAGPAAITRVKRFAVKPMTAEEAVLQMETLGHDFFLFLDAESERAGVVYRRGDGSYGLIEPE